MIDLSKLEKVPTEQDIAAESERTAAIAYLKETDWHVTAMIERGRPVPDDVRAARDKALDIVTKE